MVILAMVRDDDVKMKISPQRTQRTQREGRNRSDNGEQEPGKV
jgi:hypothetical protein|tara:strand:+ start:475 stop:603 length:129 start_codon:yes stop_codon:yes gene_type:complete